MAFAIAFLSCSLSAPALSSSTVPLFHLHPCSLRLQIAPLVHRSFGSVSGFPRKIRLNYPRSFNSPDILGSSSPISDQDDSLPMPIVHMDQDSDAYATTVQLSSGDHLGAVVAKLYIVYLGERKHENPEHVTDSHLDMLTCLLGSKKDALTSLVYSYKHVISGFAAMLTEEQAKQLAESPDVSSVQPSRNYELQPTWSWDFLEVQYDHPTQLLEKSNYGDDTITGIVDTGIWPESKSFDDDGYRVIPSWWKGVCQVGDAFCKAHLIWMFRLGNKFFKG
ncbi:subtilisin-like protease SBT3.10 isoform X2 [Zingiber officinale]|nr:subtilisin-like protease SBT3.10 isoform X2 [Zingiber officinale]